MNKNKWSQEEIDLLTELHTKYPLQVVLEIYNSEAKLRGLRSRNKTGITVKAQRLKFRSQSGTEMFCIRKLSRMLDIRSDSRLKRWFSKGLDSTVICNAEVFSFRFVSREDFKQFAIKNPSEMWGISYKNLNSVIQDSKLSKDILSFVKQPTIGRPMTVVRINADKHDEAVFRSAKAASVAFDVNKSFVLRNLNTNYLGLKKYAFVRLDYPVWWVPLEFRKEFNQVAGEVLYHLYQELMLIEGYTKLTVSIIAVRMAVTITLSAFKSRERAKDYHQKLISLNILINAKTQSILKKLNYYHYVDRIENIRSRIHGIIKFKVAWLFDKTYKDKASMMLDEFCNEFMYYVGQKYFIREALPLNYEPTNKLEKADYWSYIESACNKYVYVTECKKYNLCFLLALNFIKKNPSLYDFDLEQEILNIEHKVISDEPIKELGKKQSPQTNRIKFKRC